MKGYKDKTSIKIYEFYYNNMYLLALKLFERTNEDLYLIFS